jgi:hypothetical protein
MRRIFSVAFLVLLLASFVIAQSTNATLAGHVTDPSKASIAGARIAAISDTTNLRYETATGAGGEYYLANLPPSTYHIEVEASGFRKIVKRDVTLHVQDAVSIDFDMTLGAISETVSVEAGAPVVNTESGAVSTVIDRTFVDNLPLNGRSFQTLIALTPGVVLSPATFAEQGQFSVNGQRPDANYFSIDGVSANFGMTGYIALVETASGALPALSASGGTNSLVSVDAMQEFRIQTSSFAPEFGRMPGGQISIVTRSGTNAFHGSLFEYFRNSVLDAKDWFVNYNGLKKPAERMNDFGGVIGGPVFRNRTFFFFSHEGQRLRQPSTQQSVVPDLAARQDGPAGIRPYLNAYPMPNGKAVGTGLAEFNSGYSNPSTLDADSIRLDHALNSKFTLFGRYNYSPSDLAQRSPIPSGGAVLSLVQTLKSTVHTATIGLTESISAGMSNEVRANYSNHRVANRFDLDNFGGAVPLPDSVLFPSGYTSKTSVFGFYIPGVGQFNQGKSATMEQRQVNVLDNLSMTKGRHQLKFGVDYRWLAPFSSPYAYRQYIQFTGMSGPTGSALSGTAQIAGTFALQTNALLSQNFSLFGQDTWKVTPRLTLTYGLRWDVNPALKGKNDANDPFTVLGLNDPATMTLAPRGTPLYETTYGNVAPRLGVAYVLGAKPNWGASLRAGIGLFYDLGQGSLGGVTSYFPYGATKLIQPAPIPLSPQDAFPPALSLNPPVTNLLVADPHLKLPKSYQWNVAMDQSLGNSQTLSLTYIGAVGRDQLRIDNLANPNPNFQGVNVTRNTSTSDYHALQVKFQRRFARGLQALSSYTFSHSIDNLSTEGFATYLNTPGFSGPQLDRGNSDFDIRHSFNGGATYELPVPKFEGVARKILDGWSLDAFVFARSAPPVNIVSGPRFAGSGITFIYRPNINPGVPLEIEGAQYPGGKIFNRAAFSTPPNGEQGNFGRNVLRGFGAVQADAGLQKDFPATEKVSLRFRAEMFNIFNHPNFGSPINSLANSLFGRSTQTLANSLGTGGANGGLNPLYQVGGPRSIQFALKLQF